MTKSVIVRTTSSNYEVIIDKFLLENYNFQWLAENKQILIVKDSQVPEKFLKSLKENLEQLNPLKLISIEIKTNEETKSIEGIQPIYEILNRNKFNRDCVIISLGGGITTDMTGFVASSYLRGVSLIQIPSTLLAQVDAAIGGKTGINFQGVKNNIGAFYQPSLVLIDVNLLSSLGKNEISEGLAEIIKHSLIADKSLFFQLEQKINNGAIENDTDLIKIIKFSRITLKNAIKFGGSSIKDFKDISGGGGSFQTKFTVYNRENQKCAESKCKGIIQKRYISNRSTFICNFCQK